MILATGGTGRIGREVVKILSSSGLQVRALVRDPERALAIQNPNVDLVVGDVTRPETLGPALKGVDRVFLLTPLHPDQAQHQGNVIEAARRAAVRHVVKISAEGSKLDSPVSFGRWHARADQQLIESGLRYTILRPSYFMQNLLQFAPGIASDHVLAAPLGQSLISMVDTRDVAAVAAAVLRVAGHENRTYVVTGPDALGFGDVARRIAHVTGNAVTYQDVPPEAARAGMLEAAMPEWLVQGVLELYASFRAGQGAQVTSVVREVIGWEPRSFDQFTREHAFTFGA